MRITTRIAVFLTAIAAASVVLDYAILRATVAPSFTALEEKVAREDHTRVIEAITRTAEQVQRSAGDYGFWDDMFKFAHGEYPSLIGETVSPTALQNLGVTYFTVLAPDGHVLADAGYDLRGPEPVAVKLIAGDRVAPSHPFLRVLGEKGAKSGLIKTDLGLAVAGLAPVAMTNYTGEPAGVVILATPLDEALLERTTHVDFDIDLSATAGPGSPRVESAGDTVTVSSLLTGLDGEALASLASRTPASISDLGDRAQWTALALIAAVMLLVAATTGFILRRIAIARIERLGRHMATVADEGVLTPMPDDRSGDELSDLVTAFNAMIDQLGELREKLRIRDYHTGVADQAAAILHNMRNAVTPIATIAAGLAEAEAAPWRTNLARAMAELKADGVTPDRAGKLTDFILLSVERLLREAETRKADIDAISEVVRDVSESLSSRPLTARHQAGTEAVDPAVAVHYAKRLVEHRKGLDLDFVIPASLPRVQAQAVTLNEVIGNLFINAADAIEATGRGNGRVRVVSSETRLDGQRFLDIAVEDDGEGIDPERTTRIFERGFSTRSTATRGIGLHWSANAVIAMGGRIHAESAGAGQGASIHVLLPLANATLEKAA